MKHTVAEEDKSKTSKMANTIEHHVCGVQEFVRALHSWIYQSVKYASIIIIKNYFFKFPISVFRIYCPIDLIKN